MAMVNAVKKIIYVLLLLFTGLFIVSSLFLRAKYNTFLYGDIPVLEKQQLGPLLLLAALLLGVSVGGYRLCLRLNACRRQIVIPATLLVSFALQLLLILVFPKLPAADSQTVLSLALNMLYRHDYASFQSGGYLYMFPYNFSIVVYLKTLLCLFPDDYVVLKIFNILFSLVTTLLIYGISQELRGKARENDYGVLILAATYIPMLFMSNFIYNDIPATTCLTAAIYFFLKFVRGKSLRHLLPAAVLLAVGNYFRGIGLLVFLAAVLYLLLNIRQIGLKKVIVAICLTALLFNLPGWTQDTVLQAARIVSEPPGQNAAPVYMWLNMGLNRQTLGYWDNMQSYNIYQRQAGYNQAKSKELFKAAIRQKLAAMTAGDLLHLYYEKMIWTWTEGTYQIETNCLGNEESPRTGLRRGGPAQRTYSYPTPATALFKGDSAYRSGLLDLLYGMNFLLYCFLFLRLATGLKTKRLDETLLLLVILGFIGFYLLWEIKSRYIYPVYPLCLVLAYKGFQDAYGFFAGHPKKTGTGSEQE
jgi:hypothetical protein